MVETEIQASGCPSHQQTLFDSTQMRLIRTAMPTGTSKEAAASCIEKTRQNPAASQKLRSGSLLVADTRSLARAPCLCVYAGGSKLGFGCCDFPAASRPERLRGAMRMPSFSILRNFSDVICCASMLLTGHVDGRIWPKWGPGFNRKARRGKFRTCNNLRRGSWKKKRPGCNPRSRSQVLWHAGSDVRC